MRKPKQGSVRAPVKDSLSPWVGNNPGARLDLGVNVRKWPMLSRVPDRTGDRTNRSVMRNEGLTQELWLRCSSGRRVTGICTSRNSDENTVSSIGRCVKGNQCGRFAY